LRKSIALFVTLIFLSIIVTLINSIFGVYDKFTAQNVFYKSIAQNSLIIKNIKDILSDISDDINSNEDLDMLFQRYKLNYADTLLNIKISPLFDKININEISLTTQSPYIRKYLYDILEFYNVKDPEYFIDLIEDTIDSDTEEKNAFSEIKLTNPEFPNGKIYSYKHFEKILKFYANERRDKNIFKIPWRKLIYFGEKKLYPIDCERIDKNIASYLGLVFNVYSCEEISRYEENKKIIEKLDIISFDKTHTYFIKTEINYNAQNIKIIYDVSSKKVINIGYDTIY